MLDMLERLEKFFSSKVYISTSIYYCFSSEKLEKLYIDFDRGSDKQNSILTGGPGDNIKHVLTRGPSPPPNPTDPAHVWPRGFEEKVIWIWGFLVGRGKEKLFRPTVA